MQKISSLTLSQEAPVIYRSLVYFRFLVVNFTLFSVLRPVQSSRQNSDAVSLASWAVGDAATTMLFKVGAKCQQIVKKIITWNADRIRTKWQVTGVLHNFFVTSFMVCCDIFASGKATKNPAFTLLIREASVGFGGHWDEREPWNNKNIKV
jgi:hypothetical protein